MVREMETEQEQLYRNRTERTASGKSVKVEHRTKIFILE